LFEVVKDLIGIIATEVVVVMLVGPPEDFFDQREVEEVGSVGAFLATANAPEEFLLDETLHGSGDGHALTLGLVVGR
jgi:hypothetical protein